MFRGMKFGLWVVVILGMITALTYTDMILNEHTFPTPGILPLYVLRSGASGVVGPPGAGSWIFSPLK